MDHAVSERAVSAQPTAVVRETTSWDAFPALWPRLLTEVWEAVRSDAEIAPGRNVLLYRDDVPNVEVGVEVGGLFGAVGRVVPSTLPAGRVATVTHRGRYEDLGSAHEAVIAWCETRGLRRAGVRWEVYGHWNEEWTDETAEPEVDVYYLLR